MTNEFNAPCWPNKAPCGDCDECTPDGSIPGNPDDDQLLAALAAGESANVFSRECQVCVALGAMSDRARVGIERALAGTIGERRLAAIMTENGYPTGRRAVANHRKGHAT